MGDHLFQELLNAPDRDRCPGANPILSWREDDEAEYLDALEQFGIGFYELERRGVWHGRWAELEASKLYPPAPGGARLRKELLGRWHAAKPIVRRKVIGKAWRTVRDLAVDRMELYQRLIATAPGEVAGVLREELGSRLRPGSRFALGEAAASLADPERDLARLAVSCEGAEGQHLWTKLARLSTSPEDQSLRLRFSFGEEGPEDASHDEARHRLVRLLAEDLFPEAAHLANEKELAELIERLCGRGTFFTQHIAYWNAPGGGALFHHDSFDEDPAHRQLGVTYVQLSGRTAWLALSIEDMAHRVEEFLELLEVGEMPWVKEKLADHDLTPGMLGTLGTRELHDALARELALPGCGRLAPLAGCGPEFTSLLADAGHAIVLRPGDAILLPNHGLASTAMHSVFCASPEGAYGLSMAIRAEPMV